MYRAITFIELLITLSVMVIAIYFISPIIFHLPDPIILNNEVDNLRSFIYRVQSQARFQKNNYAIFANQQNATSQWCLIAIAKNNEKLPPCNCFDLPSCQLKSGYFLYTPLSQKIQLKSNNLYPNTLLDISGKSATLSDKCLGLSVNKSSSILQFKPLGVIYVAQNNQRTRCKF